MNEKSFNLIIEGDDVHNPTQTHFALARTGVRVIVEIPRDVLTNCLDEKSPITQRCGTY